MIRKFKTVVTLLGLVVIFVLVLAFTGCSIGYVTLVYSHEPMEIVSMSHSLTDMGIHNRITQDGLMLQVEARRLDDARASLIELMLHQQDSTFTWADAFDTADVSLNIDD